jgi:hypothetical protein
MRYLTISPLEIYILQRLNFFKRFGGLNRIQNETTFDGRQ